MGAVVSDSIGTEQLLFPFFGLVVGLSLIMSDTAALHDCPIPERHAGYALEMTPWEAPPL